MSSQQHENRDQSNDNQQQHQPTATATAASQQHPNQPPPPVHGYPPAMGYPPPSSAGMAYPGHIQPPYPGYPPPPPTHGYNNQYPYTQAPPGGGYYYTQTYASPSEDACAGFVRGIILAMILVIFLTFLSSLLTWLILHPEIPIFNLNNMTVSNFNTETSTPFTANWDAKINVENTNQKLRLYLDKIQASIYYNEEDALASTWLQPIYVDKENNFTLNANISANGLAQDAVPIWITQEMRKDQADGAVTFSLRVRVLATLKSDTWWTRSLVMRVYCEDLKILFKDDPRNGVLSPRSIGECEVYE